MIIEVNKYGGKQSAIGIRFDLIPQDALRAAATTLHEGAIKYGAENWKRITQDEHINHALNHLNLHLLGDTEEEHLTHALVRVMMAYHVDQNGVVIDAAQRKDHTRTPSIDPTNAPSFEDAFAEAFPFFIH